MNGNSNALSLLKSVFHFLFIECFLSFGRKAEKKQCIKTETWQRTAKKGLGLKVTVCL